MAYQLGSGIWNGVFAVPNSICDDHIKLASGLSVKVLLLLLRHGGALEAAEMAALLGQAVADVQDAVNYWVQHGLLATGEEAPVQTLTAAVTYQEVADPAPLPQAPKQPLPDPQPEKRVKTIASRPRLTTGEINELASKDKNITYLLQEAQTVLGKPLTPVASSTMAALYSYSGMQPDLILMLVHYCVTIGKDNMRYIERVADDWVDKGIDTHEKAEAEILRLTESNKVENRVKSAFGIHDRSLVPSERGYIRTWTEDYGMDIGLITLAYERAVELKGKLSFAYINGILTNWHKKGVTTPAQAMEEIKAKPVKDTGGQGSSYDIGELEHLIAHGDL